TVLKGNTHRLARPEFDLGTAPATLPMQRMLLVLKRSPEQESALRKLLADQQDKASPNYHKWLTPEQFGQQFGPTDGDMQTITSWLQSHGFQVGTTKGRTVLEFSGSASQVKEAFHTSIHKYVVKGEQHWANSSDPSIPTALTPAVAGVLTLHNFLKKPNVHLVEKNIPAKFTPGSRPQFTAANGLHALTPADYSIIYNAGPVQQSGVNGYGITIGIVGRSNLFNGGQDVSDFQNVFGLPANLTNILLNGPDPGDLGGDEEAEATLDTSWSAALATDATVALVVSATTNTTDGIDLSELFIIENNFFNIMTESFGSCEADVTTTDAQGISFLAEQAAAQGITYTVSTGDAGAAGCDDLTNTTAQGPVSVNVLASTPFTVAVGGTMFNENGQDATYWNTTNNSSLGSAKSYIPEDVWNETCTTACGAGQPPLAAGAGGGRAFIFRSRRGNRSR
ncbi:MAG: protease pro-enzyme activation domain-containing protein, partial [Candidatus Sulfotelmatobacter sp.]